MPIFEQLTSVLFEGMPLTNARGIIDVLLGNYKSCEQFAAVAGHRLYGGHIGRKETDLWP